METIVTVAVFNLCKKMVLFVVLTLLIGFAEGNVEESVLTGHMSVSPARNIFSRYNERITFGDEIEPHSAPFMVALYMQFTFKRTFCGGTLISRNYVLTAGHCVNDALWIELVFGAHDLSLDEDSQIRMNVTQYILYEGYAQTVVNDIALVVLPEPVRLNRYVQRLKMPSYRDQRETYEGELGTVIGWGRTESGLTDVLKYTKSDIISNALCEYYFGSKVKDTHICTSGFGSRGPCNGDSGGPLIVNSKQVGVVSYGLVLGCLIEFPNGYTRVTDYLSWIEDNSDVKIPH